MRHAETVTFGGSGLDRAAEIRGDAWQTGPHQAVILWRGKLLMNADTTALFRVPSGHDIRKQQKHPILLGRDN